MNKQREQRKDIDGLKGIAILGVIFYHLFDLLKSSHLSQSNIFNGGFLGVDVFFVVSGFLIASSIYGKLSLNEFSLWSFYKRRFFRIVPPLVIICFFSLILGYFLLLSDVYRELNIEVVNALLGIGNFRFANVGGYFSLDSSDRLLLHTWYLSITIQFYILFPLCLVLLSKTVGTKRIPLATLTMSVALLIVSCIVSKNVKGYLLTQCRIFELFLGSVLFFYKDQIFSLVFTKFKALPAVGELAGTILLITSIFTVELSDGIWTPKTSALTIVATALVILSHNKHSIIGFKPLSTLGKGSYSLYLWHWPLFIFALRCDYLNSPLKLIVIFAIIALVSAFSYKFIEKHNFKIITVLLMYAVCFASYVYFHSDSRLNYLSSFTVEDLKFTQIAPEYTPKAIFAEHDKVVWHYGLQKETPHIFFVGDSNAGHYQYYLMTQNKIPVYFLSVPASLAYGKEFASMQTEYFIKGQDRADFYELYKKTLSILTSGDKIILSNRWDIMFDLYVAEKQINKTDANFEKYIDDILHDLDEQITSHPHLQFYIVGLAIVTDKAHLNFSKLDLTGSFLSKIINVKEFYQSKDYVERNELVNNRLKAYANSHSNVKFINRNVPINQGNGIYSIFENGGPIFLDATHYTNRGGCVIGKYIMDTVVNGK